MSSSTTPEAAFGWDPDAGSGGILICSGPDAGAAAESLAQGIGSVREALRGMAPTSTDDAPERLPAARLDGRAGWARVVVLPRAPLDGIEAESIVRSAREGLLVLVPVTCSSANGALAAVRSLLPREARTGADAVTLGVVHHDSGSRPGSRPGGSFAHAKGQDAVRALLARGTEGYHGFVVAKKSWVGPTMDGHQRVPDEVLAWRFAEPDKVPAASWHYVGALNAFGGRRGDAEIDRG